MLVVGAKLLGHASFSTNAFRIKSACCPRKESLLEVIATNLFPRTFIKGTKTFISGVVPLLEIHMTTSCSKIVPKSP